MVTHKAGEQMLQRVNAFFRAGFLCWECKKRRSNTVMVSPLGVVMVLATRTAGACIRVWSTLKLSSRGIWVSFEVNRFLAGEI